MLKTPALMRVFQVEPAAAGCSPGKAVGEACARLRVVPDAIARTKGMTESIRLGEVGGAGGPAKVCPPLGGGIRRGALRTLFAGTYCTCRGCRMRFCQEVD